MPLILFDDNAHFSLRPLTFTRPVASLRIGILTIAEKWARHLKTTYSYHTQPYLHGMFAIEIAADNIFINGSVCPDEYLLESIDKLQTGDSLYYRDMLIAVRLGESDALRFNPGQKFDRVHQHERALISVRHPEDIFRKNDIELRRDFQLITKGRSSATISSTNTIIGEDLFAEEGAVAECSNLNTKNGPIYIGQNSEVWEGVNIRGAFALCNNSQVKMGAKIYGATTIGPYCRVGGEINNSVLWGNSSKGHEGYLGNSVVGEWCNFGADTNNSNLKNNYSEVKLWDYLLDGYRKTGLQFCGLIMADHAKCGINTMFNTGTVVGVSANVFGGGYPDNFVPDFSWGGSSGLEVYRPDKMFETIERVYARRDRKLDETEKQLLQDIFNLTQPYRKF
ncbi:putative sugar nucleotidyl transferase [Mucilaginibacter terrae]|uniref:UDP-N-acetylglucosamine diphosphorylase/glucosamine-1-phosphate N-acetyltransferase n=1 Tax=Mucilaginibacter terrae TaxID=1955052 RepID=A0ABU3GQE2_9SPHI|nr:putative sugar nucleotidyl transferase [Mucilaginibacter terrae]MDT3401845.1 UDP-N-acetylglucosamine diphosphorylase/glucosamine-1-phosphate N-acetyltransferase [Mucilaginibacter terrae]